MRGTILSLAIAIIATFTLAGTSRAQTEFEFVLGFKALADQIPEVVGRPLENERRTSNGDAFQLTTGGTLVWRQADNFTAFTDGSSTWVDGPFGLQQRLNSERFPWETPEIRFGALLSLTGNWSTLGQSSQAAVEVAVEDLNGYLSSIGRNALVTVQVEDTKLDPPTALEKLRGFAGQGVRLVVGPQSSSEVAAIKSFADDNGILVVSQSSTAGSLALPGDNVFRFTPDDALEGQAAAAIMQADGIRVAIPIWRGDAGNEGLAVATRRNFQALGGRMGEGVRYAAETTDFAPVISALRLQVGQAIEQNGAATVGVYLAAFDEVVALFDRAQGDPVLSAVRWYGSDGVALSDALVGNAGAARFALGAGYPNPTFGLDERAREKWEPISNRISARTGRSVEALALGVYDALWVAALAQLEVPEGSAPDELKRAFEQTANSFFGTTGWTLLNDAGDRKVGTFDYWAVKEEGGAFRWVRVARFEATPGTTPTLVR